MRIAFTSANRLARYRSLSASKLAARTTYIRLVASRISPNAEKAYQAVSLAASDHRRRLRGAASGGAGNRSLFGFKNITHAADGVYHLGFEWIIHFAAQPPDMNVHDIRIRIKVHVPDLLGDERSRQRFAGVPGQQREQR